MVFVEYFLIKVKHIKIANNLRILLGVASLFMLRP
jgi:hypothetical protein